MEILSFPEFVRHAEDRWHPRFSTLPTAPTAATSIYYISIILLFYLFFIARACKMTYFSPSGVDTAGMLCCTDYGCAQKGLL